MSDAIDKLMILKGADIHVFMQMPFPGVSTRDFFFTAARCGRPLESTSLNDHAG